MQTQRTAAEVGEGQAAATADQVARPKRRRGEDDAERTRMRRHPERAAPEQAEAILTAGRVAHVGFVVGGQPYVVPMTYHYEDGNVYLHGARASRAVQALRMGEPLCVEVTLLDGLVASRDAKSHSVNYRSVMVFGRAEMVADETEKRAVFERMTSRYFPGRMANRDYRPARLGDLRAVVLLVVHVEALSAKVRSGPPLGRHDAAQDGLGTRYVVTLAGAEL